MHDGCGTSYHARDQECYYRELRLPKVLSSVEEANDGSVWTSK